MTFGRVVLEICEPTDTHRQTDKQTDRQTHTYRHPDRKWEKYQ